MHFYYHDFGVETKRSDLSIQVDAPLHPVLAHVLPETLVAVLATLVENSRQAGAQGGTGLGLSIASSLLGVTGGKLSLLDTKDGATFRVTVPRVAAAE